MNKNLDKFDKFLRSRLKDDQIKSEDWNEPSIDIFENALDQIDDGDKKDDDSKPFPFILALLGALLISSILYNFYLTNQVDDIKLVTENSALQIAELQNKINQQSALIKSHNTVGESKNLTLGAIADESVPFNSIQKSTTTNQIFKENSAGLKKNSVSKSFNDQPFFIETKEGKNLLKNTQSQNYAYGNNNAYTHSLSRTLIDIKKIFSPICLVNTLSKAESITANSTALQTPVKLAGSKWSIGLTANTLISTLYMSMEEKGQSFKLTDYNRWYIKYGLSGFTQYDLNKKWSSTISLSYNVYHNESQFQESMIYDKNNEFSNGAGELMYLTNLNIYTPLGVHKTNMDFKVDNSHTQGDELINKTKIIQDIGVVSISPNIQYSLPLSEHFLLRFNTGLGYHRIISLNQEYGMQMYMDGKMMHEGIELSSNKNELKNDFLTINGGLGLTYKINSKIGLISSINYEHGVTPAVRSLNGTANKTYLRSINGGIGVQVSIN